MSSDFRGDPASALLEVLDPQQNSSFMDHYLEVSYDLSDVMFLTTANSLHNIPFPLRDRMEVIEIPGYTEYEKLKIAEGFLLPRQIAENGLDWANIKFKAEAIREIIHSYTMESGVRGLEREIAQVIRKIAREAVRKGQHAVPRGEQPSENPAELFSVTLTAKTIHRYLGNPKFKRDKLYQGSWTGLAYGLAWTELGGTMLPVEASVFDGPVGLILTGHLGDVMKESALTAFSYLKSHADRFKLSADFYQGKDIHVHVPEGAIPKDGPSAGITITAAMLSALSGVTVNSGFAMTGEITLAGRVLPVGGIKEKVLAAHRNGIARILLPKENTDDLEELPKEVKAQTEFLFAETIFEALRILFPKELFRVKDQ
jgi:ATP-dependent Lon protease